MRRVVVLVTLSLVATACASTKQEGGPGGAVTKVKIDKCVNEAGTQPPAAPKGVDFKTQLKEQGVLNVGSDNAFPPFEELKDGKPEGFDVDLYTEIATRMGLSAKSTTTDFDALFTTSIPNGTFDVGVSAITIKESRKASVDFSMPYFLANLAVAVNEERTKDVTELADLKDFALGVQKGTTGADCAAVLVEQGDGKEVREYTDAAKAFEDLVAGRIQAVVNDRPASEGFIKKNPDLAVVIELETNEAYGFAFSKEKPDLRAKVDEVMTEVMKDGTYARIFRKWFGADPPYEVPIV